MALYKYSFLLTYLLTYSLTNLLTYLLTLASDGAGAGRWHVIIIIIILWTYLGSDGILNTDDTEACQPRYNLVFVVPVRLRSHRKLVGTSSACVYTLTTPSVSK